MAGCCIGLMTCALLGSLMSSKLLPGLCGASLRDLESINPVCCISCRCWCSCNATAVMHAALSPRERIQRLEKACSGTSTLLPILASPPRQSFGRCPTMRSPPCVSKTGTVPNQARGPVVALERTDTAELCDAHISPGKGEINLTNLPLRLDSCYMLFAIAASIGT